jgi:hypothetical protein
MVLDMGRVMRPKAHGIITTRGKDVLNARGEEGPEPMSVITSRDTYQKGFTPSELEEYLKYMLGDEFDVNRLNLGPAGAMIQKKAGGGAVHLSIAGDVAKQAVKQGVKKIKKMSPELRAEYDATRFKELNPATRDVTAPMRAEAGKKAAELIKKQPQIKLSEALGNLNIEGKGKISTTQADRTRVGGGNIGGAPFSAISLVDPNYKGKTWGVFDTGTASRIINLNDPNTIWTTMLGSADQLKTNPIVFNKLKRGFQASLKQGNLEPELEAKINEKLATFLGEGADIRDPQIWKSIDTFEKRAKMADIMQGIGIGGEKSGKGVIFKPTDILKEETEPYLLHPEHGGDVPTFAIGPRLFTLTGEQSYRPDLHPGFPTLLHGEDLNVNVLPTETEIGLRDWHQHFKDVVEKANIEKMALGQKPRTAPAGYYDLALGLKGEGLPSQDINEEYLKWLQQHGRKDGGVIKMAKGGTPPESSVTIEGVNYEPEATYTDPMGMTVPSQDEMRLAISKQNMSPMPYSEQYRDFLKSIRDPRTGAIVKSGIEKVPSNEPEVGGMTPIDFDNLPKERTIADRIAGALETGTTLGTGMLAFPYAFGKGLMSGDFNKTFEDTLANNMYIPRDEGGIENLELLDKALRASMLPPIIPEIGGLEPIISAATKRGVQLGAKGIKEGIKKGIGAPVGMSIKDVSNLHPNVKAGIERGDIHPDDAQWMSDYAYTEGNPSVETGSGAYADQSEKMQNFIGRMERGEIPIPEHLKNKVRIGGNSSGLNPNKITTLAKTQAFSPKDEFGFYSKVEKAAKNLQRKKGDGNAFLNDMKRLTNNSPELEDSGMAEFLKNNKNLTKEDIIGFAERNRPVMKQQTLSKETNISLEDEPNYYVNLVQALGRDEDLPRIYDSVNVKNNGALIGNIFEEDSPYPNYYAYSPFADDYESFKTQEEAIKYLKEHAENYGEGGGQPLYENTSRTKGGSNYREMLVQLPEKNITQGKLLDDMARRLGAKNFESLPMEQRHELARLARGTPFTKGHYGDFPNTMINMRMDDRVDVDGKKGTLLDELQSDWHQKGKEEGYASDNPFLKMPQMSADEMLYEYGDQMNPEQKRFLQNFIKNWEQVSQSDKPEEIKSRMLDDRAESFQRWVDRQKIANAIPDAPYKKNWYELGLKKAIQQSVERGDDRLYMSTGETLADRYSLEKHFDNISVNRNFYPTGEVKDFTLHGVLHNGQEVTKFLPDLRDLDSHVGKEMAEKIKDDFANKSDSKHNYSGLDLRVGGEGMRKYYDEIYPSFLKKFAKKYGGHFGETEVMIAPPSYRIVDNEGKLVYSQDLPSKEHAESIIDALYPNDKNIVIQPINARSQKVYYYEPNPEAKKKIMGGLPYKKGGVVKIAGGGSIIKKVAQNAIKTASQGKVGQLASKDLLTAQDFHTSLGDAVRARALEAQKQMDAWDYKYSPNQYVFTEHSAKNNLPPLKIIGKSRTGNNLMFEGEPWVSKKIIDPETGKPMRTPYEPGYKVRREHGDDWSEFTIPETAIKGLIEPEEPYKRGGRIKMAEGGSMESDPSLPLRAHLRNFQTPDLLDIQDYGVSAQDNGDAFTFGRQIASKNAEEENPNLRFRTSQDYAQYSTPIHQGMLNARVMKNPEQPSIQAMLQYMQEMGGGTAGVGLMGNRTSEGDKLRALQMMYNKRLSDTSDITGALVYPFGQKPQFNVQYRKRFNEGGSVAEREMAKMREILEMQRIRDELSGMSQRSADIKAGKHHDLLTTVKPVTPEQVQSTYNARQAKPTVGLQPINVEKGGHGSPFNPQLRLFEKNGGNVSIDDMKLALTRKK